MKPGVVLAALTAATYSLVAPSFASAADAGITDAAARAMDAGPADSGDDAPEKVWASCSEHVPSGASRPAMTESFPNRGTSGWAIELRVVLKHGRGETVLPNGFHVQGDSDAARAVRAAGFTFPSPDGGSGPTMTTTVDGDKATTEVRVRLVALPPKPGRHLLELPPLPIAIARASGELITLCTAPHALVVDDPTANEPDAAPKANPPARPQRELWTIARDLTEGILIGAAVAALIGWAAMRWMRRVRPAPPPPPPRPPWELALEELANLRRAGLADAAQFAEHVDRVSDTTRRYLGALFGFDGIESTTDEVMASLRCVVPPFAHLDQVGALLGECDLVKFARMTPTAEDCVSALDRAERLVIETMPTHQPLRANEAQPPTADPGSPR